MPRLPMTCLGLALALLALAAAPPALAVEVGQTETLAFGDFRLTVSAENPYGYFPIYQAELAYRGATVYWDESYNIDPSKLTTLTDFPSPGLTTIGFSTYSGGAHCCFTTILVTQGGDATEAFILSPGVYPLESVNADNQGSMAIPVGDTAMDNYTIDQDHMLCHACSPYFRRFLVHDTNGWRPDMPGEFPQHYVDDMNSWSDQSGEPATAIIRAYDLLMAGGSAENARRLLTQGLPAEWQDVIDTVLADLQNAMTGFNPLTLLVEP